MFEWLIVQKAHCRNNRPTGAERRFRPGAVDRRARDKFLEA
jgi:hypothetical protein